MILSYLRTSFRNLFRHRLYTLVNIFGLAVGMAACILVGLFLQHEFSYDAYHRDIDRIHRVMRLRHPSGSDLPYYALGTQDRAGPTLIDELPEIEDMTRFLTRPMWAGLEDRGFDVRGTVADPNFLRFFTFPLIDGSEPPELTPGTVYITESFAQKLFGTTDVIGRTLKIYYKWVEGDFYIGGILRDQPIATSGEFMFDLLVTHEGTRGPAGSAWNRRQWSPTTGFLILRTFVRLAPDVSLSSLRLKLQDFAHRHLGDGADPRDTYGLMPLRRQHLYARRDFQLQMDGLDPTGRSCFRRHQPLLYFWPCRSNHFGTGMCQLHKPIHSAGSEPRPGSWCAQGRGIHTRPACRPVSRRDYSPRRDIGYFGTRHCRTYTSHSE